MKTRESCEMKNAHGIHENISEKIFVVPDFEKKFQIQLFRIERAAHFTPRRRC
jgi:hypothetical protein